MLNKLWHLLMATVCGTRAVLAAFYFFIFNVFFRFPAFSHLRLQLLQMAGSVGLRGFLRHFIFLAPAFSGYYD